MARRFQIERQLLVHTRAKWRAGRRTRNINLLLPRPPCSYKLRGRAAHARACTLVSAPMPAPAGAIAPALGEHEPAHGVKKPWRGPGDGAPEKGRTSPAAVGWI